MMNRFLHLLIFPFRLMFVRFFSFRNGYRVMTSELNNLLELVRLNWNKFIRLLLNFCIAFVLTSSVHKHYSLSDLNANRSKISLEQSGVHLS